MLRPRSSQNARKRCSRKQLQIVGTTLELYSPRDLPKSSVSAAQARKPLLLGAEVGFRGAALKGAVTSRQPGAPFAKRTCRFLERIHQKTMHAPRVYP